VYISYINTIVRYVYKYQLSVALSSVVNLQSEQTAGLSVSFNDLLF